MLSLLLQVLGLASCWWAFTPLYLSLAYRIWPVELAGNPLLTIVLWPPATCLAILSIRPSDGGMVFGFVLADAVIFGAVSVAMGLLAYKVRHIDRVSPWLCVCLSALTLGGFVFLGGILVDAARRRQPSPRRLLLLHNEFCRAIGASGATLILAYIPLKMWDDDPLFPQSDLFAPVLLCGLSILFNFVFILAPRVRAAALAALCKTGSTAEEREAAVLAGLVAGRGGSVAGSVDTLLQWAESHFRTISFDLLSRADFVPDGDARASEHSTRASSRRGSLLSSDGDGGGEHGGERGADNWRSEPRAMGQCDAFISHSWQDPPEPKWAALSAWAEAFEAEHGRPPSVWLDKLCIDQRNVQEALACLPIFLAGCDRLLVLAGPTYSSRLWCVMELFTFLKMGAPLERITVLPFAEPSARQPSRAISFNASRAASTDAPAGATLSDVAASFASFDAAQARCAKPEDRQALLSVIEESFGSFGEFNLWARRVFAEQVHIDRAQHRVRSTMHTLELVSSV